MHKRPFEMLAGHCTIGVDGDQWFVLYGENPQDGVVGWGDSPEEASRAFDVAWNEGLSSDEE